MRSFDKLVQKVRRDGLRSAAGAAGYRVRKWLHDPAIAISNTGAIKETLGSRYGGWTFIRHPSLQDATIVSCGAGEDITFDTAMAARFNAKVVIVDPTPRAVAHVRSVLNRVGEPACARYAEGGAQPPEAYDLSQVDMAQFKLIEAALWIERGTVKFFPPNNSDHVSHSIVDIQNDGRADISLGVIEVASTTLRDILNDVGVADLALLKVDIEGAEIEVLPALLSDGLRPLQILVEYDGLNFPSEKSSSDVREVDAALRSAGYLCYYSNGQANFLYAIPLIASS